MESKPHSDEQAKTEAAVHEFEQGIENIFQAMHELVYALNPYNSMVGRLVKELFYLPGLNKEKLLGTNNAFRRPDKNSMQLYEFKQRTKDTSRMTSIDCSFHQQFKDHLPRVQTIQHRARP